MRFRRLFAGLCALMMNTAMPPDRPTADAPAAVPNRAPLRSNPLVPLPLGSVRASGWLLVQLQLQRDGLTGRAEQVLPNLGPDSGWLGGTGPHAEGREKGPYYVRGLVALAYTLGDPELKRRAQKWVDFALDSQRPDGSFGPPPGRDEWWPRMVMTHALRQYAEATGDGRVVPMLRRYLHHMPAELPRRPLHERGKARAGDQIDTAFWVYNRTGDADLLRLAQLLHGPAYDWTDIYTRGTFLRFGADIHPKHNVNVTQALKMPASGTSSPDGRTDGRPTATRSPSAWPTCSGAPPSRWACPRGPSSCPRGRPSRAWRCARSSSRCSATLP